MGHVVVAIGAVCCNCLCLLMISVHTDSMLSLMLQALSERTLVMLMGADPARSQTEVISAAEPHVAFAYLKHLWHSDKKVTGSLLIHV